MADKFSQEDVAARAQQIERILLEVVPWDVRKKGGANLQQSLRNLWEKAIRVGFEWAEEEVARVRQKMNEEVEIASTLGYEEGYQDAMAERPQVEDEAERERKETAAKEAGESARKEAEQVRRKVEDAYEAGRRDAIAAAAADAEKALERERVWGFDVGWRLSEMKTVRSPSSTTLVPPAAPATDAAPSTTTTTSTTAADAPVPAAAKSFDWAEDASHLPTTPVSEPSPPPVRDFSCLRTDSHKPFASINRRRQRAPRHSIHRQCRPKNQSYHSHTAARTRRDYRYEKPPPPLTRPPSTQLSVALDWDRDPRLQDLGRALTALGWIRPL